MSNEWSTNFDGVGVFSALTLLSPDNPTAVVANQNNDQNTKRERGMSLSDREGSRMT